MACMFFEFYQTTIFKLLFLTGTIPNIAGFLHHFHVACNHCVSKFSSLLKILLQPSPFRDTWRITHNLGQSCDSLQIVQIWNVTVTTPGLNAGEGGNAPEFTDMPNFSYVWKLLLFAFSRNTVRPYAFHYVSVPAPSFLEIPSLGVSFTLLNLIGHHLQKTFSTPQASGPQSTF